MGTRYVSQRGFHPREKADLLHKPQADTPTSGSLSDWLRIILNLLSLNY